MSNVSGLRDCWSDLAFGKNVELERSIVLLTSASENLAVTRKEQYTVVTQHDPTDDVEETIYLVDHEGDKQTKSEVGEEGFAQNKATLEIGSTTTSSHQSVCYFDIIPDELIIKILSFMHLKELYQTVVLVCKQWKEFGLSPILWQHLNINETKLLTSASLTNIICNNCPLLKSLDLRYRDDLSDHEMLAIAKACPLLLQLTLSFHGDIKKTVVMFAKCCPGLQDMNVEGCDITDECLSHLTTLPLRSLNVSHCVHLTDDGLKVITTECHHLQAINFDGVQWITDKAVFVMVQNCYKRLEKLWLDGANITDESIKAITRCKNLKVFSLSFCDNLTDETLSWIQHMKTLYSLRLKKGVGFSATALLELFMNLDVRLMENSSGLLFLSLAECSTLNDTAVQVIAESCPNLISLNLSWCWDITDHGLRHVIVNCSRMQSLTICGLTDILGECLIDLPKLMPYLIYLDASQCNTMSDEMLFELVDTVPNMTVIDYYSEVLQPRSNERGLDLVQRKYIQYRGNSLL